MVASVDSVALRPLTHRIVEVGHRGGLALQVALTRWRLDDELARGIKPDSRRALALRATQLLRPRFRCRLAHRLERLVDECDAPRTSRLTAAVPVQRDEVALARTELLKLAAYLRTAEAVQPHGVAAARKLLTDTEDSPLYVRTERGALQLCIESVRVCLLGGNGSRARPSTQRWSSSENRRSRHARTGS
jgi:hypothetical protein